MLPPDAPVVHSFPLPLSAYPHPSPDGLLGALADRAQIEPFDLIATGIFLLAILHTFLAARFTVLAHQMEERHERTSGRCGCRSCPASAPRPCTSSAR